MFNVLENIIIDKNSLKIENITIEINKKNVCLNTDKTKESININSSNNNNNNSFKLAPIADCEIFGNSESSSSGSKTTESEKNSTGDNVSNNLKSTSDSIGNVLNNAIKVNVVDGLLKKSDNNNNSNNISKNNNNIDSCEVVSDEESESEYGLKHKQKYMCLSNSSLNDSVSSALSSSNLTVRII